MYLFINTIDVWEYEQDFDPIAFLQALPNLLCFDDYIVVASYEYADEIYDWITKNSINVPTQDRPFIDWVLIIQTIRPITPEVLPSSSLIQRQTWKF